MHTKILYHFLYCVSSLYQNKWLSR